MSNSEVKQAGRPTFRPWEEASSTISRRDLEGDWEREITKRIIALDINIGVEWTSQDVEDLGENG